ncbi:hypothetical protein [Bacillus sp. WP8]|uniref:hypothetical protein n=1 Tax=Bacillus sp. WP8 TaxID=756828 RepID=UPI0011A19136|nr:hypothetical protein [Bacillus sp. WP8]
MKKVGGCCEKLRGGECGMGEVEMGKEMSELRKKKIVCEGCEGMVGEGKEEGEKVVELVG